MFLSFTSSKISTSEEDGRVKAYCLVTIVIMSQLVEFYSYYQCSRSVTFRIDTDRDPQIRALDYTDPALFFNGFQDAKNFFLLFTVVCRQYYYIISVFKYNKSLRSHKTLELKVFPNFFLLMEGSESVQITDPGGPKNVLIRNTACYIKGYSPPPQRTILRGRAGVGWQWGVAGADRAGTGSVLTRGECPHYEGNNRGGRINGDVVIKHLNRNQLVILKEITEDKRRRRH